MLTPYSIRRRSYIPASCRREGYKAFLGLDGVYRGHFGEWFDQAIFNINFDHVLGTIAQYRAQLATCYFDGTYFQGITDLTRKFYYDETRILEFADYDRIFLAIDTLDISIAFPNKFLFINSSSEVDMNGFDITIPGRVDGEVTLTGAGSTLYLSGQPEGFIINNSLITINHTGSGSFLDNGVLTT